MKADIRAAWTEALESGEYDQGKGQLRTEDDTYCCLGVLCDLAVKAGIVRWEKFPDSTEPEMWCCVSNSDDYNASVLPNAVMEWAGLDDPNPLVGGPVSGIRNGLAWLNDNREWGFYKISSVIKESL